MYNMKGNYYKLLIENKLFVVKNKEVLENSCQAFGVQKIHPS